MFFIPGILVSIITFPGVIIHEIAHQLFCRFLGIPVYDVQYFQFNLSAQGYVQHGGSRSFNKIFLISLGPFFVNTLACLLICFPASIPYHYFGDRSLITYFMLWLGVSIGMHAFPSNTDAKNIWERAKHEASNKNILAIISFPLVVFIFIANILRFFWFDVLYGFFIGIMLPSYFFKAL